MDCTIAQTEFIKSIEGSMKYTTPVVRYVYETDRLLFAIPHLIRKVGIMQGNRVFLCNANAQCLSFGNTPEESVQKFKEFIESLLLKKIV